MKAEKSLGQHWLTDKTSLQAITDLAELSSDDVVLEIGPGQGHLTKFLLASGAKVYAVEIDTRLMSELTKRFQNSGQNLTLINQDILQFDLGSLPVGYKVVANIPYFLTGKILRQLIDAGNQPTRVVLLVQKEVARRLAAKPGDHSIISILTQHFFEISLGPVVVAKLFSPPPKVDSQVVILKRRQTTQVDFGKFSRLVRVGFSSKRKKLANNLKAGLGKEATLIEDVLLNLGLEDNARAQELSLEDWYNLTERLMA